MISAILTTVLTELARDLLKLQEDAAIGLVFTTLFALGIILVTVFTRNSHIGVEVITGNVDALHQEDIRLVWGTAFVNFILIALFFRQWVMTAFDEKLSFSVGIPTKTPHVFDSADPDCRLPRCRSPFGLIFPRGAGIDCTPVDASAYSADVCRYGNRPDGFYLRSRPFKTFFVSLSHAFIDWRTCRDPHFILLPPLKCVDI